MNIQLTAGQMRSLKEKLAALWFVDKLDEGEKTFLIDFLNHKIEDQDKTTESDNPFAKPFVVTSLRREDLITAGFEKDAVLQLTDTEMSEIASDLEDDYIVQMFWDSLETATHVLQPSIPWENPNAEPCKEVQ